MRAEDSTWAVVRAIGRRSALALADLRSAGVPEDRVLFTSPDDAGSEAAERAVAGGAARVLVVGGDGTQRAVAGVLAGTDVVQGVVATGTANLFALNLGHSARDQVRRALGAQRRPVDIGWAELDESAEQPFLVVAGMGNDARTIASLPPRVKRGMGWPGYILGGFPLLADRGAQMSVGERDPQRLWSVLVANSGRLPAGIRLSRSARLDDGLLHVVEVRVAHVGDWAPIAAAGVTHGDGPQRLLNRSDVLHTRITAMTPLPVQLDGDLVGRGSRLRLRVEPRSLLVA